VWWPGESTDFIAERGCSKSNLRQPAYQLSPTVAAGLSIRATGRPSSNSTLIAKS
jgi:hypothetical protein